MHPQEWRDFARELWEKGWKPSKILDAMQKEFTHRVKYRTLKTWADDGGWKYFEDSDTPKKSNPNEPFGVSGITDPMYHLSLVMGKRLIREDSGTRSITDPDEYGSKPSTIVAKALEEIDIVYDPGPDTIDYLKPVLTRYVHSIRRATKAGRENRLNEDPQRNRRSRNRLDAATEEVPLLDGAYRIISESFTDQILKPPEEQEASEE